MIGVSSGSAAWPTSCFISFSILAAAVIPIFADHPDSATPSDLRQLRTEVDLLDDRLQTIDPDDPRAREFREREGEIREDFVWLRDKMREHHQESGVDKGKAGLGALLGGVLGAVLDGKKGALVGAVVGTQGQDAIAARLASLRLAPDLVFFLGDNIYWRGSAELYKARLDDVHTSP